jgi:isoleucyl-tRNA synthetase
MHARGVCPPPSLHLRRYGVWANWEEPYVTLQPQYEAAQIGVFGQMVLRGHIYRGRKPVHWSPSSRTALAEAELEYPEGHVSRSIYVAMPLVVRAGREPLWRCAR